MTDFDVPQVREAAALAMHAERFGPAQAPDGFEHCGHGPQFRREAGAALAVIVTAVTQQIRGLHYPYTVTIGTYCRDCGVRWPCSTARLLDQLDAAATGDDRG